MALKELLCTCAPLLQSCLTLCDPMDCSPPGSSVHEDSPGKNTGVGCHAPLQGIFPIQYSNSCLLHLHSDFPNSQEYVTHTNLAKLKKQTFSYYHSTIGLPRWR